MKNPSYNMQITKLYKMMCELPHNGWVHYGSPTPLKCQGPTLSSEGVKASIYKRGGREDGTGYCLLIGERILV